jgi:hypothetical protein
VANLTTVIPADAPPGLGSAKYATDYNEVLAKGAATGSTRTPDETVQGVFWAYDGAQRDRRAASTVQPGRAGDL